MNRVQLIILLIPVVLFSLTCHEYSHGRIAYILGDDTAKKLGRLSFNPLKHLDFLGVLVFYFVGFGWAKPVPVDWRNFHNPRRDMMYVAIAGPLANLTLAVFFSFFLRVISPYHFPALFTLLCFGVYVNVALAIFNMLPIFPLDGASVIKGLVSQEAAARFSEMDRFGGFLLLGIILLDSFAHTRILGFILLTPLFYSIQFLTQEAYPMLEQVIMASFSTIYR
ncbi:MAG: site-2 protease family protein [Nitrospinota bacterium]|nr:site-2 protease family protein [Nitrospinota bacterium]